jgi:hypothetical protein
VDVPVPEIYHLQVLAKHLILLKCSYKRYPTTQTRDTGFGYVKLLELEFKGSRKLVDLFVLQ